MASQRSCQRPARSTTFPVFIAPTAASQAALDALARLPAGLSSDGRRRAKSLDRFRTVSEDESLEPQCIPWTQGLVSASPYKEQRPDSSRITIETVTAVSRDAVRYYEGVDRFSTARDAAVEVACEGAKITPSHRATPDLDDWLLRLRYRFNRHSSAPAFVLVSQAEAR